ncbi:MAG: hypothetical protein QXD86_06875 [Candidatus Bathyarchaeia archaeon]
MSQEQIQEKIKEIKEELERMEGINISELREMFDDVIDLTINNPDFSVFMLRKENFVIIYCTDRYYCKNYALVFNNKEKAEALVEIAEKLSEELFDQFAFSANEFVTFIKNTMLDDVKVEELE